MRMKEIPALTRARRQEHFARTRRDVVLRQDGAELGLGWWHMQQQLFRAWSGEGVGSSPPASAAGVLG